MIGAGRERDGVASSSICARIMGRCAGADDAKLGCCRRGGLAVGGHVALAGSWDGNATGTRPMIGGPHPAGGQEPPERAVPGSNKSEEKASAPLANSASLRMGRVLPLPCRGRRMRVGTGREQGEEIILFG